jgi:hypothetical protein
MAIPRVFVSSTCFDLKEVRDSLSRFIKSYGFDPILSEHGDVFYHPDLHTQESCIHEVSNCQLFILLIGGRFGGNYIKDKEKSITNAEYEAAKQANIPVFTYIKKGVYDNHNTFQANKDKEFIKEMDFPNIEKQEHALDIFSFIDNVRKGKVNNAFETFEVNNDIEIHLRKQWAGMFFDYLKNREVKEQVNVANLMLSTLQTSSEKLEEMLKGLYKPKDQEETLDNIEQKYASIRFFKFILNDILDNNEIYLGEKKDLDKLSKVNPKNKLWYKYLIELGSFQLHDSRDITILRFIGIGNKSSSPIIENKDEKSLTFEKHSPEILEYYKNGIQKLNEEERKTILSKFLKS